MQYDKAQKFYLNPNHILLIKSLAQHIKNKSVDEIDCDDLEQSGFVALLEAHNTFDLSNGVDFNKYVYSCISSAMHNEIYNGDWTPKRYYKILQKFNKVKNNIEANTSVKANHAQIARGLNIDITEYNKFIKNYHCSRLLEFDESVYLQDSFENENTVKLLNTISGHSLNPLDKCNIDTIKERLTKAIDNLPEQEKVVLSLYYDEELCMNTIGQILNLSESRISQIHKNALNHLRCQFVN